MALGHFSYALPFSPQNWSQVYWDDLNLLKKRRPSNMEWTKIRAAIDVVDSIPEVNVFIRDH